LETGHGRLLALLPGTDPRCSEWASTSRRRCSRRLASGSPVRTASSSSSTTSTTRCRRWVASPTDRLHRVFFEAIDEPLENEDPSDRTLDVETQLGWLREIGFEDVDCCWKWREMALLAGVKP
jgi:hypothetical protein